MKDQPHAVEVPVIASVPVECLFWAEDDGWKGACAELSVAGIADIHRSCSPRPQNGSLNTRR